MLNPEYKSQRPLSRPEWQIQNEIEASRNANNVIRYGLSTIASAVSWFGWATIFLFSCSGFTFMSFMSTSENENSNYFVWMIILGVATCLTIGMMSHHWNKGRKKVESLSEAGSMIFYASNQDQRPVEEVGQEG